MSLVELALIKEALEVDHTAQDNFIQKIIDGIEDWVGLYCGISLGLVVAEVETVNGGGKSLHITNRPISAITLVEIINDAEDVETVDSDEYQLANNEVIRNDESRWLRGRFNYRVTYNGGYSAATLPAGLEMLICDLVRRKYDNRGGKSNQAAAGFGTGWQALVGSDMLSQLEPYRLGGF